MIYKFQDLRNMLLNYSNIKNSNNFIFTILYDTLKIEVFNLKI